MREIKNLKFKIKNSQKGYALHFLGLIKSEGYTLIELLAVIIILVTVGTIITSILVTSLRGGNKSNTTNDVRQNGNYIITQMSKMILYAKSFDGVSTNGSNYVTDCLANQPPAPTPTLTPIVYKYIKISSFDGGQTTFSCANGTIASGSAAGNFSLLSSSFSVTSCSFLCTQTNLLSAPTININFTLSKANAGFFVENQTTIPFETSITPRNN